MHIRVHQNFMNEYVGTHHVSSSQGFAIDSARAASLH